VSTWTHSAVSRSVSAFAVGALVPLGLAAQDIDVAALTELDDDDSTNMYEGFTVEQLVDMKWVRDGEVIGEVESVLADASGEVVALAIDRENVRGDDDEVVVPIADLELIADRREVETTLNDEDLAGLPVWED
jgi:hypothetical protein